MRIADGDKSHWVELWEQPLRNWIVAHIYNKYETWCWKTGLTRLIEKLPFWRKEEMFFIPFGCRQDIRCFDLVHKNRTSLLRLQITEEQFKLKQLEEDIEL